MCFFLNCNGSKFGTWFLNIKMKYAFSRITKPIKPVTIQRDFSTRENIIIYLPKVFRANVYVIIIKKGNILPSL